MTRSAHLFTRTRIMHGKARLDLADFLMFGRYNYASARVGLDLHHHPDAMEFCYLVKGRQSYRVGHRDYVLGGGDVFLTFPNEQHSTGGTPQGKGVLYWIILRIPKPGQSFLGETPASSRILIESLLRIRERCFPGTPVMKKVLDEMLVLLHQRAGPLRKLAMKTRLMEFLLQVIASGERHQHPGPSAAISAVMRHVERHLDRPISVRELATQAGLSVSRFKTRFRLETGIPPSDYILRCKVEAARTLLRSKDKSITEVAFDLGFSSSQYFATVFKRYTGHQPSSERHLG